MRPAKFIVPLVFLSIAGYFFASVREVLLPFLLAAVLAYLANPVVRPLEQRGFKRDRMVLLLYVGAFAVVALAGWAVVALLAAQFDDLRANLPRYVQQVQKAAAALEVHARRLPYGPLLVENAVGSGQAAAQSALSRAPNIAAFLAMLLEYLLIVPFICFFLMAGAHELINGLLDLCPSRYVEMVLGIFCEIEESLGAYVRGILLEALAVGALTFLGLAILGVNYSAYLGLLVGVANLVPYAGPVVGTIAAGAVALVQFQSVNALLGVVAVFAAVKFVDDWVFQPIILKRAIEMHPVLILFSLMAGGELWGFLGIVFAVPVACVVKVTLEIGWEWYRTEFNIRPGPPPIDVYRVPLV